MLDFVHETDYARGNLVNARVLGHFAEFAPAKFNVVAKR